MQSPVFLFSLPRSGSTLLQRVLMSHRDIASIAEPWLMLPFIHSFKKHGTLAEYSHSICYTAFGDLINNLPNKEEDYFMFLARFATDIYASLCTNHERYFLDKTPRYYLIIPEIVKIFPDAKFIFLFRNLLDIYSSILTTWVNGRFIIHNNYIDIDKGPRLLSEGYALLGNKAYAVKYENFVSNPKKYIEEISEYLQIPFDESILERFIYQDTKGRMGDPTGISMYKDVDERSQEKWKITFNTKFRQKILFNHINKIEDKVFSIQGYDKSAMLESITALSVSHDNWLRDRIDYSMSYLFRYLKINVFFAKRLTTWTNGTFLS